MGERIEKRRFDSGTRTWRVTRYLYEGGRLLAEANDNGDITRTYVYLGERALALLEGERRYYLHTDYRHAPVAVSDATRTVRWQAVYAPFGWAQVNDDPDQDGKPFTLNLRLPGQYYDAETATHYNYQRDYDPKTGRYLTPDPLGVALAPTGVNPYGYVSNQPLTKVDPYGTYEEDVHYYMTFFLGVVAGMDPEDARRMALATQFIDDNRTTQPVSGTGTFDAIMSIFRNSTQLKFYHFVLSDPDRGTTLPPYQNADLTIGTNLSPQLQTLLGYALQSPALRTAACGSTPTVYDIQLQFFGEFLHAYQDTFAHRDRNNVPYNAVWRVPFTNVQWGVGHGLDGHEPDYTFDNEALGWTNRAARTLAMEREVYGTILAYFGDPNRPNARSWERIEPILVKFNSIIEGNMDSKRWRTSEKVALLNKALRDLGYADINLSDENEFGYDETTARENRANAFRNLDAAQYPNAILATETE